MLYHKPPSYDNIKVFGCLAFAKDVKPSSDKFGARSRKCVFLGYTQGQKGFKLYDLEFKHIFTTRDVFFYEF